MLNDGNSSILQILQSLKSAMDEDAKDRKCWVPGFVKENSKGNFDFLEDNFNPSAENEDVSEEKSSENGFTKNINGNEKNSICVENKIVEITGENENPIYSENGFEQEMFHGPQKCISTLEEDKTKGPTPPTDFNVSPRTSLKSSVIFSVSELAEPTNNTIPPPPNHQSPPENSIGSSKTATIPKTEVFRPPPPPPMPTEENNKTSPSRPKGPIKLEASPDTNEFFQEISSKFQPEKFTFPIIEPSKQSPKMIMPSVNEEQNRSAVIDHIAEVGMQKKIGVSAQEIYKAIISFDFENLTYDAIEILLENARKEQATPPGTKKSKDTTSYRNVLATIENGKQILKSMLFFKSFVSECKRLEEQFSKMKQVFQSLTLSAKQSKFCQLIRNIIEFANTSSGDSDNGYLTNGFKIETLCTLWETKPFNGKSGMSIFVGNLTKNKSTTLTFYEDFDYLHGFSCPDSVTLTKDLKILINRLEQANTVVDNLSKGQKDTNFDHILKMIPPMENRIKGLEDDWDLTTKSYKDCLAAYGQTEKEPCKFLLVKTLQNFIKEFKLEKQVYEAQIKKNEKSAGIKIPDSPTENKTEKPNTTKKHLLKPNEREYLPGKTLAPIPETSELEKALMSQSDNFGTGTRKRKKAETKTESQNRERISTNTYIR